MKAGIFITTPGQVEFVPLQAGQLLVTLCDFNDSTYLAFAIIPVSQELPLYIKHDDRWYSRSGSWNETLPEEQKPRQYYRQPVSFQPREGAFTVETVVSKIDNRDTIGMITDVLKAALQPLQQRWWHT